MTGAAEMGSAAKTSTSEVRPTDEASTGEVASPTETSSSSETSAPVGGISLLNRGRRKKQPACEGSYCNNYTHFHERISLGSWCQRPPICLRA